jgi:tetratricopeptide (TPR) repeat protein
LIDQFRDQETTCLEKIDVCFCTQYPHSWGVKKELAVQYQKIGIYMSAHELLKSVGLHEDSIKCLFMAGRQTQAIELAETVMKTAKFKNYNLLCLMGEMKADHTWFERAWEESDHKCSKAMRQLGRYYFFENKYKEAIECF